MKEILDLYNWSCPEVPKKIYIKPRAKPSQNFGGRDDQFGIEVKRIVDEFLHYEAVFPATKSKPISSVEMEQGYKIAELEREIDFHKNSLIKLENSVGLRLNDYNKLDVDYRNVKRENRMLEERVKELEESQPTFLWLMQQHLNLKKELGK